MLCEDWVTCTDAADPNPANRSTVDLANRRVTANLQPGETLRCVFTNVRNDNGAITITKRTIGALAANTGGAFNFTNSGGISGSPTNPAAFTITTTVANPQGAQSLTGLTGNLTYTIVKGLKVAGEIGYTHGKTDHGLIVSDNPKLNGRDSYNNWLAGMRITRQF